MSKVYLLPVACYLIFQITFICTYIAAVVQRHVVPNIPYISDAATYSPESCFFGLFMNIGSIILGLVIYTRYRQIQLLGELYEEVYQECKVLNRRGLWIGLLSCFGISIVANFQETNVRAMHYVGALLCFGFGTWYFWLQSLMSYYILPRHGTLFKAHMRMVFSVMCTIFFFVVAITGIISHILFIGPNPRKWYPSDGGWYFHVASSVTEWIMSAIFSFYILSFTDEFRILSFDHPPLTLLELEHERQLVESDQEPIIPNNPEVIVS